MTHNASREKHAIRDNGRVGVALLLRNLRKPSLEKQILNQEHDVHVGRVDVQ